MQAYTHKVGPVLLLACPHDLDAATPANWTFLGPTNGPTTFNANIQKTAGMNDLAGALGIAGSTFAVAGAPTLQCQLLDETKAVLALLLQEAGVVAGTAVGLAAGLKSITEMFLAAIPVDEAADGADAANGIFLAAADVTDFGTITRALPSQGQNPFNARSTTFTGRYLDKYPPADAVAMPSGTQIAWIGGCDQFAAPVSGITLPDLTAFLPA